MEPEPCPNPLDPLHQLLRQDSHRQPVDPPPHRRVGEERIELALEMADFATHHAWSEIRRAPIEALPVEYVDLEAEFALALRLFGEEVELALVVRDHQPAGDFQVDRRSELLLEHLPEADGLHVEVQ